ncbi:unnamed protein product [Cuscuta epithymum]|uniref:Uncharacterized protein n=1 Tax=Cuscuta epithymum TaxID=186058 RepID=A0AAV0FX59_9ASTE|nr:unnamed protein product [Cuscuta epithymum]
MGLLDSSDGIRGRQNHPGWNDANVITMGNLFEDFEGVYGGSESIFSGDEFLGHASENEKRTPISTVGGLWDSDTNEVICKKALLVTPENCLPTQNLSTQKRLNRKKNQRSHLMRTRSQSRTEL